MSLSKGLVLKMRLDEESFNPDTKRFTNMTPHPNHGTGHGTQLGSATPGFQADRMGQLVRSAPFNGSNDGINISNSPSINFTSDMTISMWIYLNDAWTIGSDWMILVDNSWGESPRTSFSLYFRGASGDLRFARTSSSLVTDKKSWDAGWYNIIIVSTSTTGNIYINGVPDGTTDAGSDTGNSLDIKIGKGITSAFPFLGKMGEFRMYDRGLSQQERTLLYDSYRV